MSCFRRSSVDSSGEDRVGSIEPVIKKMWELPFLGNAEVLPQRTALPSRVGHRFSDRSLPFARAAPRKRGTYALFDKPHPALPPLTVVNIRYVPLYWVALLYWVNRKRGTYTFRQTSSRASVSNTCNIRYAPPTWVLHLSIFAMSPFLGVPLFWVAGMGFVMERSGSPGGELAGCTETLA